MIRILFYTCLFLLLSTALTSFGWYLACNKPCDPEIVQVKGDTVYIQPEAIGQVIPLQEDTVKQAIPFIKRIFGGNERDKRHKVKEGQNLYRIGLAYNLTAEELRIANKLENYDIKAGQWLTIPKKTIQDTVYTYEKSFSDSAVKGTVWTQSFGPILSQSIKWESLAIKPKNRLFGGLGMDDRNRIYGMGAYEMKSGWLVTGAVGDGRYQFGVLKRIK